MTHDRSLPDQIAQVERKLDLRRERTRRHWDESRAALRRLTDRLPLMAAAGALAVGVIAGRSRPLPATSMSTGAPTTARVGFAATALTVVSAVARLATSPAARSLWQAYRAWRRPATSTSWQSLRRRGAEG